MTRRNPWVALESGADPVARARELRRAHARYVGAGAPGPGVRGLIADSWRRCTGAGVPAENHAPPRVRSGGEVREFREEHPLARMMPTLRELLIDVAEEARHLMVVCAADGELLWVEGPARIRDAAEETMNFAEGTLWSEAAAGTNALGTALAVRHPIQVFAAEHFNATVHPWTCSAAPIFDPESGDLLGTIDLTGPYRMTHPHSLALVTAAAGAATGALRHALWRDDERLREAYVRAAGRLGRRATGVVTAAGRVVMADPIGWLGTHVGVPGDGGLGFLPGGRTFRTEPIRGGVGHLVWEAGPDEATPRARVRVRALGAAEVWLDDRPLHLSPRHAEVLVLLAAAPDGLSAEELAEALRGPGASPITARSEVSRLRRLLGPALATRPYRLEAEVETDFLRPGAAVDALLPGSTAPGIAALRRGAG